MNQTDGLWKPKGLKESLSVAADISKYKPATKPSEPTDILEDSLEDSLDEEVPTPQVAPESPMKNSKTFEDDEEEEKKEEEEFEL